MSLTLHYQQACPDPAAPARSAVRQWLAKTLALAGRSGDTEITVRIVDEAEMRMLNGRYRGRQASTNVLSFVADLPPELGLGEIGDIVVCAPVVKREARAQGVDPQARWAHMVVHGALHLLGHDHQSEAEACAMEALETQILTAMAFDPPYPVTD